MATPKEKNPFRVIVDTREQKPLDFLQYNEITVGTDTLSAGDYTVAGLDLPGDDYSVIFERKKDCQELASNLVMYWDRFTEELSVLSTYKFPCIIVCKPYSFEYLYEKGFTKVHPNTFVARLEIIQNDFRIPVMFMESRESVERFMYRTFTKCWQRSLE
jgi:ERCC4-type nuclease